tara:strand:- start:25 stop:240 length:216 start_codon:yes stop_codon:yes gene_type:complete
MQAYSDPNRADDATALPDVEVFYNEHIGEGSSPMEVGWYWQSCFPGCLPDGDPVGPFETEVAALADAQDIN